MVELPLSTAASMRAIFISILAGFAGSAAVVVYATNHRRPSTEEAPVFATAPPRPDCPGQKTGEDPIDLPSWDGNDTGFYYEHDTGTAALVVRTECIPCDCPRNYLNDSSTALALR